MTLRTTTFLVPFVLLCLCHAAPLPAGENWPEFRGPTQQGHADATGLPVEWSEQQNVKWKTPIPGEGWSSPVIWGDQIWMTTATEEGHSLRAVCVNKNTGKVVHDVEVFRPQELEPKNELNSFASPTPVVEDGRVYVSFGDYGSACLDTATGKTVWTTQDLKLDHQEGPGSSPVLYKDYFVLHCDGRDVQYVVALDKRTGKIAWKTNRTTDFGNSTTPDYKKAFCIPLILQGKGGRGDEMISVGASRAFCYDPADGREIWACAIPGFSNVPRPVAGHGMVYLCTGYMQPQLWAVRLGGEGDITNTHVAWKFTEGVPAKPSILLVGNEIYMVSDSGIARCIDAKTGAEIWKKRIEGTYTASPIFADGRIYFPSEKGLTTVIKPGRAFELLAENELDGRLMASPAVSGKGMYLRTDTHLYRIEK